MHLGELSGWISVALGQIVTWPQVLKLRRERGDGVSLASYAIVTVSMSLFFVHAIAIRDVVSMVSVPVSLVPNIVVAVTLARRRGTWARCLPRHGAGTERRVQRPARVGSDRGVRPVAQRRVVRPAAPAEGLPIGATLQAG